MAKQPPRHDEPAQQPDDAKPKPPGANTPGSPGAAPKPTIPNMSIDEPEEVPLDVEEVFEDDIPVVVAAPQSDVAAFVLADDAVAEEVTDVEPFSGVVEAEAIEEPLVEAMAEDDVWAAEIAEAEPVVAAPASEVDLMKMFDEAQTAPVAPAATYEPYVDPWNPDASEPEPPMQIHAAEPTAAPSMPMDKLAAAAAHVDEDVFEEALEEAAPASEVFAAEEVVEEIAEAAPASEIVAAEESVHAPASEIVASADHVHAAPLSEIVAAAEHVHAASASEIVAAAESVHSAPASEVRASPAVAEAAPASEVWAAEDVEEIAEASPASEVLAAEEAEEYVEAMPESVIVAAEEVEEVAEASDVLFDEAIAEAASEVKSAEVAEEVAEAVEEPSSASRKAEGVLDDEVAEEVGSVAEIYEDATEVGEPISAAKGPISATTAEAVLDDDEVVMANNGSSAVLFDEAVEVASAAAPRSGVADFDQTMAFERPSSAAKKADDDVLMTEEEFAGVGETSAVNLGGMPARKGSSAAGIDKVAEAIESDVDIDSELSDPLAKTVPSVEFDELLDEADEIDVKPAKKKKPVAKDDEFTEMDAEAFDEDEIVVAKKKGKAAPKATGDDIDLDALFAEGEPAEAVDAEEAEEAVEALDAEEAAEAEAAEAFDAEEAEAAEAFDDEDVKPIKKTKMGAKTSMHDDEEDAEAVEEDDVSAKKKKDKDKKGKKDKATVAPAPAQSSTFLRVFIGMVLGGMVLVGGAAAGLFLAPGEVRNLVNEVDPPKIAPPPPPKPKLAVAHEAMDKSEYDDALAALDTATAPDELTVRGEARWLKYLKAIGEGAPDAKDPEVGKAVSDLTKGSDRIILGHVKSTLEQKALRDEIAQAKLKKEAVDKELIDVTTKKETAEKKLEVAEKKVDDAAEVLVKGKHIDDKAEFSDVALAKILKSLTDKESVLDAVNKILDSEVKGAGVKALEEIVAKRKDAEDKVAAVDKVLAKETKITGDKGILEIIGVRNKLNDTVKDAIKELAKGQIVIDKAEPRDQLLDGIALARQKAESPLSTPLAQIGMSLGSIGSGTTSAVAETFSKIKIATELGWYQGREKFIETPQQKMSTYVTLLQDRGQNNAKSMADIRREADWVLLKESKSDADAKSKARYVQGLTLRNEGKFAEAKIAFEDTLTMIPAAAPWGGLARKSVKELTDPNEYYVPRIKDFLAAGNSAAALMEADTAIKAIPAAGRLFIQRGLVRLDVVQPLAAKIPENKQAEIRADADEAKKKDANLASESLYLRGLLEERLENWPKAEELFSEAIEAVKGRKDMTSESAKYRIARGRLLLREPTEAPTLPPDDNDKPKKDDKVGVRHAPQERTIVLHPWSPLIVSVLIAQPEEIDADEKLRRERLNKAIEDANELIKSDDTVLKGKGYLLRGQAKSQLGERTEGLKEYAEGLNLLATKTKISAKEIAALVLQIENHPAFRRPDAATPNPLLAERHFGEGLHYYWSKKYPQAEAQFKQALKYYESDARYEYFLGLAQYQQKSRKKQDDAKYSFEQGAIKEAKAAMNNADTVREVNASLERIQGDLRQHLNTYRYKAQSDDPDSKK